jgi:sporulation protein YlmC with PRC-barrel domain
MASPDSNPFRRSLLACAVAASVALSAGVSLAQNTNNDRPNKATTEAKRTDNDARKAWEQTHRASKIIGSEVRNPQDQKVGSVKDLVIGDPSSGTISHVVVAVGGVMGMGDKLFAVPFRDLQQTPGKNYLVLSTSSDLSQAFDEKSWPDQAAWREGPQTSRTSLPPAPDTTVASPSPSSAAGTPTASSPPTSSTTTGTTTPPPPASTSPSTADTTPQTTQ